MTLRETIGPAKSEVLQILMEKEPVPLKAFTPKQLIALSQLQRLGLAIYSKKGWKVNWKHVPVKKYDTSKG